MAGRSDLVQTPGQYFSDELYQEPILVIQNFSYFYLQFTPLSDDCKAELSINDYPLNTVEGHSY